MFLGPYHVMQLENENLIWQFQPAMQLPILIPKLLIGILGKALVSIFL